MKLTKGQRKVLEFIRDEEELIYEKGAGWWLGYDRLPGKLPFSLIRLGLIKQDSFSNREDFQYWTLTGCGEQILKDENYTPLLVEALKERNKNEQ